MDAKPETIATYDRIAADFSKRHFDPFWIDEFAFYQHIITGKKVVDLGCGAGRDAAVFAANGFDYTGVDASAGMLAAARKRVPQGKFLQMDFGRTDFSDNTFDGFWAAASFLHMPKKDIANVLQEAKRITKKAGVGFISVKEKIKMDEGVVREDKYNNAGRYFSFYTKDEYKKVLESNGFTVVKVTTRFEDEQKTTWLCFFVQT